MKHKRITIKENNYSKSIRRVVLFLFIFIFIVIIQVQDVLGQFRACIVKIDITPDSPQWLGGYNPRQSNGVHDHIFLRIVGLDDGKTQLYIVSSDLTEFAVPVYDELTSILGKDHKINPLNVWWGVTHNHSAPVIGPQFEGITYQIMANRMNQASESKINKDTAYTSFVINKIIEGILEARESFVPAKLGVGWGFSNANINRRAIDENGNASLGLNPDLPTDKRIGLLRIDKLDGSPIALIVNYPMHGTVLGPSNLKISGDAPGIVSEYVEQKIGAPMVYIQGGAGDLAPIYSVYPNHTAGHLDQFKVLLGDKILDAYRKISSFSKTVKLTLGSLTVETLRKPGLEWPSYLKKYSRTTSTGAHLVRLPIRFLRINEDIAIWSAPVEMFCEIPMEIRRRSPFPYTFYFGYMNGTLDYLPTLKAWEHGGYEPSVSPFTQAAEVDLSNAVIGYLQGELRGEGEN